METHYRVMDQYVMAEDFVGQDATDFGEARADEYGAAGVFLQGGIGCRGNLIITVRKFLEILSRPDDDNPVVETRVYKYNVSVRGHNTVFRYDNEHPWYLHSGHHDPHHKHLFDWQTGQELRPPSPVWVGASNWPHLNRVIEETREWYHANRDRLPEPEGFPRVEGAR